MAITVAYLTAEHVDRSTPTLLLVASPSLELPDVLNGLPLRLIAKSCPPDSAYVCVSGAPGRVRSPMLVTSCEPTELIPSLTML